MISVWKSHHENKYSNVTPSQGKREDIKQSFNTQLGKLCVRITFWKEKAVISTNKVIWKAAEETFFTVKFAEW